MAIPMRVPIMWQIICMEVIFVVSPRYTPADADKNTGKIATATVHRGV
jgi:hypothetical protein